MKGIWGAPFKTTLLLGVLYSPLANSNLLERCRLLILKYSNGPTTDLHASRSSAVALISKIRLGLKSKGVSSPLLTGEKIDDVVFVVHQSADLENKTTLRLRQREFKKAERLLLHSSHFPVRTEALSGEASILAYSTGGELAKGIDVNAKRLHIMGGYCELCATNAVSNFVGNLVSSNRTEDVEVIFYPDLIYFSKSADGRLDSSNLERHIRRMLGRRFSGKMSPCLNHAAFLA